MPISIPPNLKKLLGLLAMSLSLAMPMQGYANDIEAISQMLRKGDLNGALARANQVLAKTPKDAQVRFLKGLALADLNRTNEAIEVFTSITEDYPELPEPYNNLAVLYAFQGKYDAARNALEMAIRTHPSYATAHENLGDLYAKMASQAYDKALQIDSSNKVAKTKLALIKDMMSGQPRKIAADARSESRPEPQAKPVNTASAPPQKNAPETAFATPSNVVVNRAELTQSGKTPEPDVVETINAWAKAWSSRDVETYLEFYSPDFSPASLSRADWVAQRRERIGKASHIFVVVRDIRVQRISPNRAIVNFKQTYQSDKLKNTADKTMDMELVNGKWRILRESGR